MIVGLTGRVGSGKSQATHYLIEKYQPWCIDLDELGHDSLTQESVILRLSQLFGTHILTEDKQINRSVLGGIVFSDKAALIQLNQVVHPIMKARVEEKIKTSSQNGLIAGALLKEIDLVDLCDVIITIDASDEAIRQAIGEKFDKVSPSQLSREGYKQLATYCIENAYTADFYHHLSSLIDEKKIFF